jgi:hypothetical protein
MGCICRKEDLFFREDSRDASHWLYILLTVHIHDLIGLKNQRFRQVKNDWKGKNGLIRYDIKLQIKCNIPDLHCIANASES